MPASVRYLMRGLGSEEEITELASYLLFDGAFCGRLIEIGRADVAARSQEILDFLAPRAPVARAAGSREKIA
ncbi:MAG: hypothetical protein ACR2P8_08150 [Myxococcota bacterium]